MMIAVNLDFVYDLSVCTVRAGIIHSSESPSETLQSLPVSAAVTMNFAPMQTKAANDC